MVSNSYGVGSGVNVSPIVPSSAGSPSVIANMPTSQDSFQASDPKNLQNKDASGSKEEKKEGKNWIPHWIATGLSWFGGIFVDNGFAFLAAKCKIPHSNILGTALSVVSSAGFEWFRQQNNDGKTDYGSIALNGAINLIPFHKGLKLIGIDPEAMTQSALKGVSPEARQELETALKKGG